MKLSRIATIKKESAPIAIDLEAIEAIKISYEGSPEYCDITVWLKSGQIIKENVFRDAAQAFNNAWFQYLSAD